MRAELIHIGNDRAIRIPEKLIEQCGFGDTVDVRVQDHSLVISPNRVTREGWEEAFVTAGPDDGVILDPIGENDFDRHEWRW